MSTLLTKSRFMAGQQCPKRLWLEVREKHLMAPVTPAKQAIFDTGHEIGRFAHRLFPGGQLISGDDLQDGIDKTSEGIAAGIPAMFEACLIADDLYARIDILRSNGDGTWDIIEVKSSTSVKPEHIVDVAFQRLVAERSGLTIRRVFVMHVNRQCVYPDLDDLLTTVDVTSDVDEIINLEDVVSEYRKLLLDDVAECEVGKHCSKPYQCPFKEHCWSGIPIPSVFDLPRISAKALSDLRGRDIIYIEDVPADFALTTTQQAYADVVQAGQPRMDQPGIENRLNELEYPIHFLDFETDNPAIPRFDDTHPYDQVPFQYSCHILHEDGSVEHHEYLHPDRSDPRPVIAAELTNHLGDEGSVVVYYASFERRRLLDLAAEFPDLAPASSHDFGTCLKSFRTTWIIQTSWARSH